jgi:hypothetical protein
MASEWAADTAQRDGNKKREQLHQPINAAGFMGQTTGKQAQARYLRTAE